MVTEILDAQQKEQIAAEILHQLPDWFGLPESTERYIEESKKMPFWAWREEENGFDDAGGAGTGNRYSGFLALKETSPYTAEIYVMGVLPKQHRRGIGRKLYHAFENYAKEKKYSYLQVKTVQSGHYAEYDRTNEFYQAMGFREFECLPSLWDERNPCQVYVKYIEPKG